MAGGGESRYLFDFGPGTANFIRTVDCDECPDGEKKINACKISIQFSSEGK